MQRPLLWLGAAGIILAATGATLWVNRPALPRVPWGGGKELRVLKVSFGTNHVFSTESFWKQCLRRVLPQARQKPLGPFAGHRLKTRFDSLVVWVAAFDPSSGLPTPAWFENVEATFVDGSVARGRLQGLSREIAALEFPSYARDRSSVGLQLWESVYVSTGFVPSPADGSVFVLAGNARARDIGVPFVPRSWPTRLGVRDRSRCSSRRACRRSRPISKWKSSPRCLRRSFSSGDRSGRRGSVSAFAPRSRRHRHIAIALRFQGPNQTPMHLHRNLVVKKRECVLLFLRWSQSGILEDEAWESCDEVQTLPLTLVPSLLSAVNLLVKPRSPNLERRRLSKLDHRAGL